MRTVGSLIRGFCLSAARSLRARPSNAARVAGHCGKFSLVHVVEDSAAGHIRTAGAGDGTAAQRLVRHLRSCCHRGYLANGSCLLSTTANCFGGCWTMTGDVGTGATDGAIPASPSHKLKSSRMATVPARANRVETKTRSPPSIALITVTRKKCIVLLGMRSGFLRSGTGFCVLRLRMAGGDSPSANEVSCGGAEHARSVGVGEPPRSHVVSR